MKAVFRWNRTLVFCFFITLQVNAGTSRVFITGKDLLEYCQQSGNFCFGFVTAVVDDTSLTYGETSSYCLPSDINAETLQAAVIEHMENNAQILELPGAAVVVIALKHTYPCQ